MSDRMLAHCGLDAVSLNALATSKWKHVLAIASFLYAKPPRAVPEERSLVGNLNTSWFGRSRCAIWKLKMCLRCSAKSQLTEDMMTALGKSRKVKMRSVVTASVVQWGPSSSSDAPTI